MIRVFRLKPAPKRGSGEYKNCIGSINVWESGQSGINSSMMKMNYIKLDKLRGQNANLHLMNLQKWENGFQNIQTGKYNDIVMPL